MIIVVDKENDKSVNLKKVDQALLAKSLKKFKVAGNGNLATSVKSLYAKLNDTDGQVGDCTVCGGAWPVELAACPFCGDEDREDGGSAPTSAEGAESSFVPGGTESEEPPEPSTALAMAEERRAALPERTALGKVQMVQKEEDLDQAVANINIAKEAGAKSFWIVVQTLKRILDTNLWKLRTDDKGEPLYKSWSDFASKELEYSRTYVERLLKVTAEFNKSTVEELGAGKLILVYSAPPNKREEVLAKARAGASRQKLQAITKELNEGAGKNPGNSKKPLPPKLPEPKVGKDEITLAIVLGKKQTVHLFSDKKDASGALTKPAKKLDDNPFGWLDFPNGVRQTFQLLRMPSGQLKLMVTMRREA